MASRPTVPMSGPRPGLGLFPPLSSSGGSGTNSLATWEIVGNHGSHSQYMLQYVAICCNMLQYVARVTKYMLICMKDRKTERS